MSRRSRRLYQHLTIMSRRKYSLFQIATDNGTTEFEYSYEDALATYGKYDSATIYGQPVNESLPMKIIKSK